MQYFNTIELISSLLFGSKESRASRTSSVVIAMKVSEVMVSVVKESLVKSLSFNKLLNNLALSWSQCLYLNTSLVVSHHFLKERICDETIIGASKIAD